MPHSRPRQRLGLVVLSLAAICCAQTTPLVDWTRKNAVPVTDLAPGTPLDDLRPVGALLGDARVVFIGEARHDAREHLLFRRRLIELLVTEHGFTVLALEEPLPNARPLDDYIQTGRGDPAGLLDATGNWFIWDTEEMLGLVEWLRGYNAAADSGRKVRLYGLDITNPAPAVENALLFVGRTDSSAAETLREALRLDLLDRTMWTQTMENYAPLADSDLAGLEQAYDELVGAVERSRDDSAGPAAREEFAWVLREAQTARAANRLFSGARRGMSDPQAYRAGGIIREQAMADNLRWVLERHGPEARVIVLAHNIHVGRAPVDVAIPGRPVLDSIPSIASLLDADLGDGMFAISCLYGAAAWPEEVSTDTTTVEHRLGQSGLRKFLLGLRSVPADGLVAEWLRSAQRFKAEGGIAVCSPAATFDALFYVDSLHRTTPGRVAAQRLGLKGGLE